MDWFRAILAAIGGLAFAIAGVAMVLAIVAKDHHWLWYLSPLCAFVGMFAAWAKGIRICQGRA